MIRHWARAALAGLLLIAAQLQAAKISFHFENPQLDPAQYELTVDDAGNAVYSSEAAERDPLHREFKLSPANVQKIFALARELNFFSGDYDFRKHKIAFSGHRTLTYTDGTTTTSTRFNWSENKQIMELAGIFEGLSNTVEAGATLADLLHHDKLGLNAYLISLEKKQQAGWLQQLELISPILQQIADDGTVMDIARRRARKLLLAAGNRA